MRSLVSAVLLLSIVSGCAQIQTFRVVDAQSGQPVESVRGERLQGSIRASELPLVLLDSLSPVEAASTNASGSMAFEKAGTKFWFNPSSKNPAYGQAYVTATWSGATIHYPDECRDISVKAVNGVVEVPLPSRTIAKAAEPDRQ
jgi:hypothetical protein